MSRHEIKYTQAGIEFYSPYSKSLVADLKSKIPQSERAWNPSNKCWLVHNQHKSLLDDLSMRHIGKYPDVIGVPKSANVIETKILNIKYIGAPKDRGGGENLSFAIDFNGNWNAVFSESVLRDWFECGFGSAKSQVSIETKYSILAISRTATGSEIKKAYRRMSKRFHPDVCHDDDADEMFKKIKDAYEELSNPLRRRKYDAALSFEASLDNQHPASYDYRAMNLYRPPLRCGLIMATGKNEVGRFVVEKILQWEPIMKGHLELVTSWSKEQQCIIEEWV